MTKSLPVCVLTFCCCVSMKEGQGFGNVDGVNSRTSVEVWRPVQKCRQENIMRIKISPVEIERVVLV